MQDWEITSDRLLIRPMRVDDATNWHRVRAAAPFDPLTRSVEESIALITAMQTRPAPDSDGWQQFAILSREGRYAGDLGLRFSPPWNATCEIGFAVDPALQGRGIASEATGAMVAQLFKAGRRRVVAITDSRNRPAQRVLERNWFRLEGRFVESWREGDAWYDELSFARLAKD
ncbi:MAG: GNAT family N-acetyltransferase [Sandarakinorhabdus sp.]|jgi:RimJ/RimL family protein N-acetyltransferase|nr:GNAT family N-acetyltransferase [Sandarakinorhabdus sp.]